MNYVAKFKGGKYLCNDMDVVGHYAPGEEAVTLFVEKEQGVRDGLSDGWDA